MVGGTLRKTPRDYRRQPRSSVLRGLLGGRRILAGDLVIRVRSRRTELGPPWSPVVSVFSVLNKSHFELVWNHRVYSRFCRVTQFLFSRLTLADQLEKSAAQDPFSFGFIDRQTLHPTPDFSVIVGVVVLMEAVGTIRTV